ncbi:ABC transporter permease [Sporolactobacillus sp. THM19-2]|nr:ABC transporter permease [Sporolactobacillus sp. THM19-2]
MNVYIAKRLLSIVPVLIIVAVVIFTLIHLTGDPASVILGPEATPDAVHQLQQELGLDRPLYQQFIIWFSDILRGNFGDSVYLQQPVLHVFVQYLGPTLNLSIFAEIIALIIAIPMGILTSTRKGSKTDQAVIGFSLFGISLPNFLLGMFLILLFSVNMKLFPVSGYVPVSVGLWNHIYSLILPAFALGFMQAAIVTRMTRSSMIDVLSTGYIKTARSKGLSKKSVIYKHAFRNALPTVLEVVGQQFSTLIAGAIVIETVFNIPGLGQLMINSIQRRDFPLIEGIVLIVAVSHVMINLIIDLLYGVIDPRVRLSK